MKEEDLIKKLKKLQKEYSHDPEVQHSKADNLLLEYINSEKVRKVFYSLERWYS